MLLLCYIQNFFKSIKLASRQQGCIPLLTVFCYKVIVAFVGNRGIYGAIV